MVEGCGMKQYQVVIFVREGFDPKWDDSVEVWADSLREAYDLIVEAIVKACDERKQDA
jgi:hypothetical protein